MIGLQCVKSNKVTVVFFAAYFPKFKSAQKATVTKLKAEGVRF